MALFTAVQQLCTFSIVAPLFITFFQLFWRACAPSARSFLRLERFVTMVFDLWHKFVGGIKCLKCEKHFWQWILSNKFMLQTFIFVDVPYWPPYSTDKFISCVVLDSSQWLFHFGEEVVIARTQRKRRHLVVQNLIILHDNARSHTAPVTDVMCGWEWDIL